MSDEQNTKAALEEAHAEAVAAVRKFREKVPIKLKGRVVDHACAAGRVHRLILKSAEIDQTNRPDLTKRLAEKRVELEREAVARNKAAVAAIKKYVEMCKFLGEQPKSIRMRVCDCGYCQSSTPGRVDLMLMAGSVFRRAVVNMIITEDGFPDFSAEAVEAAKDAFEDYHMYAQALGKPVDVEHIFYNEWG